MSSGIDCANGPEFVSQELKERAYTSRATLDFTRRGRPTDNAVIESSARRFPDE